MTSKEEKYQRFLDAQEHPEKYSDEQLDAILGDAADIVSLKRALMQERANREPVDTDAAWHELTARLASPSHHSRPHWPKIAAAFAGGVVATSVAIAAIVGLGIVGNPFAQHHTAATAVRMGDTTAVKPTAIAPTAKSDSTAQSLQAAPVTVNFDNVPLAQILSRMAAYYNVEVTFSPTSAARDIRLCFAWDQSKSLADNIALLNSFRQISIVQDGKRITVE